MSKTVTLYEYDRELRPGTIGADFNADDPNKEFTRRYDPDEPGEALKLMRDLVEWLKPAT
jgi:hypothetical protein